MKFVVSRQVCRIDPIARTKVTLRLLPLSESGAIRIGLAMRVPLMGSVNSGARPSKSTGSMFAS
jgi:hypothetical protein